MKKRLFLRILGFFVTLALLIQVATLFCCADTPTSLSAQSAVLIDAHSGRVLFKKSARERMGMASTTKIMTALTVLRLANLTDTVSIPREAVGTEGSSVYLCEGEKMTVEQLLYALLLASANDAAVALAVYCSGSTNAFAEQMNAYARELGLTDTHFTNPHGLYDDEHYTTAYDLSLIARAAMATEVLRRIVSTPKTTLPFEGEENKRLVVNHNKLLRTYDGAIGVKTGFTKKTGRCLVSAAEREGLMLIAVTLNAPNDWQDHTALLDWGFEKYERRVVADTGELSVGMPICGAEQETVTLTNTSPIVLTVEKSVKNVQIDVCSHYRFLYAPVCAGERVATAEAYYDGERCTVPLEVREVVQQKKAKSGFLKRLVKIFKKD